MSRKLIASVLASSALAVQHKLVDDDHDPSCPRETRVALNAFTTAVSDLEMAQRAYRTSHAVIRALDYTRHQTHLTYLMSLVKIKALKIEQAIALGCPEQVNKYNDFKEGHSETIAAALGRPL